MKRPHPTPRFVLTGALLAATAAGAAPAAVPSALVGAWFSGAQLPDEAYASPTLAHANSARFVFNQDGTYQFGKVQLTHIPGYAPMSTLLIACESLDVTLERGTFTVRGGQITLKPTAVKRTAGVSPAALNGGCKRFAGVTTTRAGGPTETDTWRVAGRQLTIGSGKNALTFARRTPSAGQAATTALPAELRGEWNSGRIAPTEYYNAATGKWAEASGTSVILKLRPDATYERTGLLVVTTYNCTSKLLVQEQGRVAFSGDTLSFTPTTSASTGYTCSPGKVSRATNTVKPYRERVNVRVNADGQRVLSLTSASGTTLFNRPLGTPPESAPATGRAAVTPPTSSAASPTPAPARWTASGDWDAVLTLAGRTYRLKVTLQDDSPRILGFGAAPVEYANGNSATGDLDLGLTDETGDTFELTVQGRFDGDRYEGQVRGKRADLGTGTLTLTRR